MTYRAKPHSRRFTIRDRQSRLVGIGLLGCVAVAVALLLTASPVFAAESPRVTGGITEIHPTRATIAMEGIPPSDEKTSIKEVQIEYSTSEAGPFIVLAQRLGEESLAEGSKVLKTSLTHLAPETVYYVRLVAVTENGGRATETLKFTTPSSTGPELSELRVHQNSRHGVNEIGTASATLQASIETNFFETNYSFEYATSEAGPYTPFTSKGTGKVTVAEEFATPLATVTGLTPETIYYVRATAENSRGRSSQTTSFTTEPTHPTNVNILSITDLTGTSGVLSGLFDSHSAESRWLFEYSTSEGGPWTPGPEGTTVAAEASEYVSFVPPVEISGLKPGTKYYIRLTVDNGHGGPVTSSPETFETAGPPEASTFPTHAIEGEAIRALGNVDPHVFTINELQTLKIGEAPSGGTYTLSFEGHTTAPIPFNAEYFEVEEALWTLPGLSPLDLSVQEAALGSTTYTIEFLAALGGINEPQISADATGLTPAGTVTMATLQNGSSPVAAYHVQYVSQKQFEVNGWAESSSTSEVDTKEEGIVGLNLPGLEPGNTYHFRFVASNSTPGNPVTDGNEETLTVPAPAHEEAQGACPNEALRTGPSAHLPDCRAYEQITPVEKAGAEDVFHYGAIFEGTLIGADGEHVFLHAPGVNWGTSPDPVQSNYFFTRTPTGWQMTSTKPSGEIGPDSLRPEIFSPDLTQIGLSSAWVDSAAATSPEIEFRAGPVGGPYQRIASVPRSEVQEEGLAAGSADGSKYVLQSTDRTLAGHRTGTTSGNDLYEFSEGQLRQLNVLGGSPGATISACGAEMAVGSEGTEQTLGGEHSISSNGSRVFFTDNCTHHLYMRVNGVETIDLGEYNYAAANTDGSKVLLEKHDGNSYGVFLDETATQTITYLFSSTEPAVQRGSSFDTFLVSEDFSTIYFTSTGRLTSEAPPIKETGDVYRNVYRYDLGSKTLHFIMEGSAPRYVSPNGRYFYFGYSPSHDQARVFGISTSDEQVYSYNGEENVVECVSCAASFDPNPKLPAVLSTEDGSATHDNGAPVNTVASANGDYVFFDTASALLPQDVDGERVPEGCSDSCHPPSELQSNEYSPSSDVYEWRKDGVGGCTHIQGCLALITTGKGGFLNELLGTDPSGRDVFFATHESLVSSDDDTAGDIYDARIGGGFPPPATKPVECEGDSCSTPFAPPSGLTPSSSTFRGAGDLTNGAAVVVKAKPKQKKSTKLRKRPKKKASAKTRKRTRKKAGKSSRRNK